jgi:calcineurin-like phosphoesterase
MSGCCGGTAYQSDLGMCGDYDSVIGMDKGSAVERFQKKVRGERLKPAEGPASLCGLFVETDDRTGLAKHAAPLRVGGCLTESLPEF